MTNTTINQDIPFGAKFANESVVVQKTDPHYSAEKQISANHDDLGTSTYMSWTEDHDA